MRFTGRDGRRSREGYPVEPHVRRRLLTINRTFYERFAAAFASTRFGKQPGYDRLWPYASGAQSVLDLGCGNARLARFLAGQGWRGIYWGIDISQPLLALARQMTQALEGMQACFLVLDLAEPGWSGVFSRSRFDVVFALALLHHIPSHAYRQAFVTEMARLVRSGGYAILSTWRFLHNTRMRRKIVPWETIGLRAEEVEAGDYLLDWKKEGIGYRYVHHVTEEEMTHLATQAGLHVVEMFHADGREGDLSLYAVLRKAA